MKPYYHAHTTLDDLLNSVFRSVRRSNIQVLSTKGRSREVTGTLLKLNNPRARFSRTEQRGTLFSCLGETLWYFSASDALDHIEYYIPKYSKYAELPAGELVVDGAYGPRLFGVNGQVPYIIKLLQNKLTTRRAVIQIFDQSDHNNNDVPCTCIIQYLCRDGQLHSVVYMRSNDAYRGLPHDIFAFTMLQEYIALSVGLKLGTYTHTVGSLHLYDDDLVDAACYLEAGYQEELAMPEMPDKNLNASIKWLLNIEEDLRNGANDIGHYENIEPYWVDLARLLLMKRILMDKTHLPFHKKRLIVDQKNLMTSKVYNAFIRSREDKLQAQEDSQLSFFEELTQ